MIHLGVNPINKLTVFAHGLSNVVLGGGGVFTCHRVSRVLKMLNERLSPLVPRVPRLVKEPFSGETS